MTLQAHSWWAGLLGVRVTTQHQSPRGSALGGEGRGRIAWRVCERQLVCVLAGEGRGGRGGNHEGP